MRFPDEQDPTDDPGNPRLPRRMARLVCIDSAVVHVLETHLDRIDRKAPLPSHAVDAVNAALAIAAPVCARLPRRTSPTPFAREKPVRPADAFLALMQVRETVNQTVDALIHQHAPGHPPSSQP